MTEAVPRSLYERVGGGAFFERLVEVFYEGIAGDEVLAPLYPEYPDFTGARQRLALFLQQYWGGPTTYSDERGHPRLRMRHFPYAIGERERDHWMVHMSRAVDIAVGELAVDDGEGERLRAELDGYFAPSADHMRNQGLQQIVGSGS